MENQGDEEFARDWASDLGQSHSPREAATLRSTGQAAVRAWQRFSDRASVLVASAQRRTSESIRKLDAAVRAAAPAVGRGLLAISQVAAVAYAEHLNAQYRRADEALRAKGWWALSSWNDEQLQRYDQLARSLGRRALADEICRSYHAYGGRALRRMVNSWSDEPALHTRRLIIRDALADHLAGRYRVSVPTLMPCIEGVIADGFGLGGRMKVVTGLEPLRDVFDGLEEIELEVAIESLLGLYSKIDFGMTSNLSPRLNRHLILHGRSIRYGTEANSLKVFFHLDEIHQLLGAKRQLEEGRTEPLERRPIKMANDLVKALGVPDEIIKASRDMVPLIESRLDHTRAR